MTRLLVAARQSAIPDFLMSVITDICKPRRRNETVEGGDGQTILHFHYLETATFGEHSQGPTINSIFTLFPGFRGIQESFRVSVCVCGERVLMASLFVGGCCGACFEGAGRMLLQNSNSIIL